MCQRHSFVLTPAGKVLDGCGLTDSHTTILSMHGLASVDHDRCNLYEWQPPEGWPQRSWAEGLTVDRAAFEPKARATTAMERHIRRLYPDAAAWSQRDPIRWSELPLPDADRVQRSYELALRTQPLRWVEDAVVLDHVRRHLTCLGCAVIPQRVANPLDSVRASVWDSVKASVRASAWASAWDSVWASVRASAWASAWDSVWDSALASVRDSAWDSAWDSVRASFVREDADNPWLPLAELAALGCYLYGVADDGTVYVWRWEKK